MIRDKGTPLSTIVDTLRTTIYDFYKNEPFCAKEDLQTTSECSFKMLTYGQWATGAITSKPMWNMEQYIIA